MQENTAALISIQLNGAPAPNENLLTIKTLIEKACAEADSTCQHKLVVLPECFSVFGVTGSSMLVHAESEGSGHIQNALIKLAVEHQCYIVAGTTPIKPSLDADNAANAGKYYAASLVFSPCGKCIARYNKIHLFDVQVDDATKSYKESQYTIAGDSLSLFETPFGNVAQSVCYDLRFPNMFSAYSALTVNKQAPDIIVVPSAFTYKTGHAHWHALLKARSIENQCYIVAANQVGTHADKRTTYGNSCIYSPWGDCLSVIENGEGYALASYNKEDMAAIRANMPIGAHKKELYT